MDRENQKAFFASLAKKGFPIRHERTSDEEISLQVDEGTKRHNIESHDHYIDFSQASVLKELKSGKKPAIKIIDDLTGTKERDRLRYDLRTPLPLVQLQKMGKIKLVGNEWALA